MCQIPDLHSTLQWESGKYTISVYIVWFETFGVVGMDIGHSHVNRTI